ncbi:MAG: 50S ribosomal protein L19 [Calditrichota bacterium]
MESWKSIIQPQIKTNLPKFGPGDTVDIHYRVVEGEKERIQIFTGVVIAMRGSDMGASFTVRKISSGGVGVERIFPRHSPFIADVKIRRAGKVRRAKLYYLRKLRGKAARVKEKIVPKGE